MLNSSVKGLDSFFKPRGIAVIGASEGDDQPGTRVIANFSLFGYPGQIYPVTRRFESVQGIACYQSVTDVPDPVDMAIICASAQRTPETLRECGRRGIAAAVLFANGFGSEASDGPRLQSELEAAQRESGIRVLGPNTLGFRLVLGAKQGIFATFAHDIEGGVTPGRVAIIAQSGGLGAYFGSAYLRRRGVGTRYLIDTGNELDVDSAEGLEYVAQDPDVGCIGLILEGSRDGRRLAQLVRTTVAGGKPVVILKTGRSPAAARQMASHTGALSGSAGLFQAALSDAGANVARDEVEFVDALVIHGAGKAPKSRRMGVVSMSGGFAILAIDSAEQFGMELPQPAIPPTPEQEPHLRSGTLINPFDYQSISAPGPQTIRRSLEWMLGQPNIDAVVLWQAFGLQTMEYRRRRLEADLLDLMPRFKTPLFGCGMTTPEFEARLRELGVLWFEEPTRLIKALSLVSPRPKPAVAAPKPVARHTNVIVGVPARQLLQELEHVRTVKVHNVVETQALARDWGRVILKVESCRFPHKTEFGLVTGPLAAEEVPAAFDRLLQAREAVGADDEPLVAQPYERGIELALGAYIDPIFGPSIMIGTGGIFLEIMRDTAFATAPISEKQARDLILQLRGAPLLLGARGTPRADVDAAARALANLSRFIVKTNGAYDSVDVNPLIVRGEGKGAVAADALLVPH